MAARALPSLLAAFDFRRKAEFDRPMRRGWQTLVFGKIRVLALVAFQLETLAGASNAAMPDDAAVELDWRKQDGIGTERAPVEFRQRHRADARPRRSVNRDLQTEGCRWASEAARWEALRQDWRALATANATTPPAWEDLWRRVHRLRREMVFANPLAPTGPLLFVKQVPGIFSHQLTQYYGSCARPGGGIFVLDAPGESLQAAATGRRRLAARQLPASRGFLRWPAGAVCLLPRGNHPGQPGNPPRPLLSSLRDARGRHRGCAS